MKYLGPTLALAFIGLMLWWQVAAWHECRETNSFFYCLRIISK